MLSDKEKDPVRWLEEKIRNRAKEQAKEQEKQQKDLTGPKKPVIM